ncbi:MAG: sporulation protein YqfD [Oscillospiraceae bacterium]|nr:sporulation protein YqfD [Oscillospiraceae bacterium]
MSRIERKWRGELSVEISGAETERVLNACLNEGVALFRPRKKDAFTLTAGLFEDDREALEAICARSGCELRVKSSKGGSRNRKLFRRRRFFLLPIFLLLASMAASSLFIWEIRTVGAETLAQGEILRALEECGVHSGTYRLSLDADRVRDEMLLKMPELAWITVNVHGSVAEVILVPRSEKPELFRPDEPVSLVASRGGIVRKVSVYSGRSLVSVGQTVVEGELLVSSELDSLCGESRLEHAAGEIWADTWYEITEVRPAETAEKRPDGAPLSRFALKIGNRRVNFYFDSGKALDSCDKITWEFVCGIPGLFSLPLRFVREEYRPYALQYCAAGADEGTGERMLSELAERIDGEIVSSSFSVSDSGGRVIVTLRAQCYENIARERP